MSWNDEVKRRDARPVVCVEILLNSGTLYYADRDFREGDTFWEGRVNNVGPIRRGVSLDESKSLLISDVTITFNNNDEDSATGTGRFNPLLPPTNDWLFQPVNIYLKFIDDDGGVQSKKIYGGLGVPGSISATEFVLNVHPVLRDKVNLLQKQITPLLFNNLPHKNAGVAQNIILGTLSSTFGAVLCPVVDTSAKKLSVAQHACKSVDKVIKVVGDVRTTLTLTTHYTVNLNDTDDSGNTYTSVTIAAGQYDVEAKYYADVKGLESAGNGTGTLYENPASAFEQFLLQFTNLTASDIDSTSFTAAEATCTNRGYDTTGYFGTCIPESAGELEAKGNPWPVLQNITHGFHHKAYITVGGKVGLTSIDITASSSPTVNYEERSGDFYEKGLDIDLFPIEPVNDLRVRYQIAHSANSGTENIVEETNEISIDRYQRVTGERLNRTAQNANVLLDVDNGIISKDLALTNGTAYTVTWTVPGLWGLQENSDVGDYVNLSHVRGVGGEWANKALQIISVTAQLGGIDNFTTITAVANDEKLKYFDTDQDAYIESAFPTSNYGSSNIVQHGEFLTGVGSHARGAYRYNLGALVGSAIIKGVSIRIYHSSSASFLGLEIRKLESTTWDESTSTWNSFDDSGAWNDSNIGDKLSNTTSAATRGIKRFLFNSTGESYVSSVVAQGETGLVQITHQSVSDTANAYTVVSSGESPVAANVRPVLIVAYTQ